MIHALPGRWNEVTVQAGNDNNEPLEPHPNIDEERNGEEHHQVAPQPGRPEKLRRDDIAGHQRPEIRSIGTDDPVEGNISIEDQTPLRQAVKNSQKYP